MIVEVVVSRDFFLSFDYTPCDCYDDCEKDEAEYC